MNFNEFKDRLDKATTEEDVKGAYTQYYNIKYDTAYRMDLYTPQILFEFKIDKNLRNLKSISTVLAQPLYYVRRLKYGKIEKPIPYYICLATKKEAALIEIKNWISYYTNDNYNWGNLASKPDDKLIDHLIKEPETSNIHIYNILKKQEHEIFSKLIKHALGSQMLFDFGDKKEINEENFEAVYEHWKSIIGHYINNGYKPSLYFLSNLQKEKIVIDHDNNQVVFSFDDNNSKIQKILMKDYDYFWNIYNYIKKPEIIKGIHSKLDRLTDENQRRFEGEFYTPLDFCLKAIEYFNSVLVKNWYKTGKYRIWDMCAGTGNLEYHLPAESYKYLYMSTLHSGEIDHLKKVFPNATCFQYDYLNDDIEYLFDKDGLFIKCDWKLPKKLRDELKDPNITWVIYINPPFGTAQDSHHDSRSKKNISKTKLELIMDKNKIAHAKRELFVQFIYRIVHELPQKTYLGIFSKLKYLNAPDSIDFRNKYFSYCYKNGFIFKSTNFSGVTGKYPVSFLIWDLSKTKKNNNIEIDILNNDTYKIGIKHLRLIDKEDVLNNWFERPKNSNNFIMPALSNAINIRENNKDKRHRARPDFLASIASRGNDFQSIREMVILSSPNVSAGAFTVIAENFEKALVLHAVKKISKPTWTNDRNQFLIPHTKPNKEFIIDCVIWSLFSSSNETSSLKDVKYLGNTYQIKNNFYPFIIKDLKKWEIENADMKMQMINDTDRFVAKWLTDKNISSEAKEVMEKAKIVYKIFYKNINKMIIKKWKINNWDVGWYQIRNCLKDNNVGIDEIKLLNITNEKLAKKILPDIEKYGFLDKDEIYDNI